MTTIGGGYVWPNITITSDGERVVIQAEPTQSRQAEPLRYVATATSVIQANEFDNAVDTFVTQVLGKLSVDSVRETNLEAIWDSLLADRADSECTLFRKFEALLGSDPGEADERIVNRLIEDSKSLGKDAMAEIAAAAVDPNAVGTATELSNLAHHAGESVSLKDVAPLDPQRRQELPVRVAAWKLGAEAARLLRAQERLNTPIDDKQLCTMGGVSVKALTGQRRNSPISFALDANDSNSRIVLRPKYHTGRRFALARLIGDRLTQKGDKLLPATGAITYRQKFQRSFAAELLCPFDALEERLGGDFSTEAIEDASQHFVVSPLAVRTMLVNRGLLEREALNDEDELAVA
ncbi:MAG: ImmA/IrrE family metallo-endopeptidase [Rhodomicrobium sp.]